MGIMGQIRRACLRQHCGRPFAVVLPMRTFFGPNSRRTLRPCSTLDAKIPTFLVIHTVATAGGLFTHGHTARHSSRSLNIGFKPACFSWTSRSALPQRQPSSCPHVKHVSTGRSRFIVATHSLIRSTFPPTCEVRRRGSARVRAKDTSHYHITRGILHNADSYWKHLRMIDDRPDASSKPLQPTSRAKVRRSSR